MVFLREGLCPGLTADVMRALKAQRVRTVMDLVSSDIEELARQSSVSYKTLVAVRRVLLAQYSAFPSNGADLYEELMNSTAILSTGNKSLDTLLDSGLYTGEVTELTGAPGSGKTQVCLGVAVNVSHDLKQNVLYVDSTGGLTASRLFQMVKSRAQSMEEQMDSLRRIEVVRVFDVFKMMDALQDLRSSLSNEVAGACAPVKAVIVDSVPAVIAPILGSKQAEGLSLMMQIARELKSLAKELSIAVLVTNHVTYDQCGGVKPALGRSWSYVPNVRVLLKHKDQGRAVRSTKRIATLLKSSRQPTRISVDFDLETCGFLEEQSVFAEGGGT